MYLSPLSPVLGQMLSNEDRHRINYLHTTESIALKKIFLEKVAKTLLHKEHMLLVIPDDMPSTVVVKLLASHNLAHFTLHLTQQEILSEAQLKRLRQLGALQAIPEDSCSFRSISQKLRELKDNIDAGLDAINQPIDDGPCLKTLILDEVDKMDSYIYLKIQRLQASLRMDTANVELIYQMQQCHQKTYDYMDALQIVQPLAYTDPQHLAKAQEETIHLNTALSEALEKIETHMEEAKMDIKQKIQAEQATLIEIKDELKFAIFENEVKETVKSFEEVFQKITAQSHQLQYLSLDYQRQNALNWGEAPLVIAAIDRITANIPQTIEEEYKKFLNHLTPFNIKLTELSDQLERAQSILRAVNNCEFLNIQTPKKYLQISDILNKIKDALHRLRLAESCLMDQGYCHFRQLAHQAGLNNEMRSLLTSIKESNWRDVIRYHTNQEQIKGLFNGQVNRLPEWINQYRKTAALYRKLCLHEIHNRWCKIREQSITTLKNEHWNLYQSIWMNGVTRLSSFDLYHALQDRLLYFCPIAVIQESDINSVMKVHPEAFNQIVFLDFKHINEAVLRSLSNSKREISIITTYNIDTELMNLDMNKFRAADIPMSQQPIHHHNTATEKYKHAVSIANNLIDIVKDGMIFKWKEQIIISTIDTKLNEKLLQILDIQPQHIIYQAALEQGHLVEAILTESKITILGENGLINDHLKDEIIWQLHLISELKNVDIPVLSIPTVDLYRDKNKVLNKLKQQLSRRNAKDKKSTETQTIFQLA